MTPHAHPPLRRRRPLSRVLAGLAALAVLVPAAPAYANSLPNLPHHAGGYESSFSPAYDYDTDGCYAVSAISQDGRINGGLRTTGAINGSCRDRSDLDMSQTYARSTCNNGWCAIVYASYFEKDQAVHGSGLGGHRHDWEHVISWVDQATDRVEYVTTTQHSSRRTYPRAQVRFDGTHPKVVYHKDGASTHFFRLANANDEPPENHYGTWHYPPVVDWNGWPSLDLRNSLMAADFGAASIKIKDGAFEYLLGVAKPTGIPFDPYA
ncbi:NPP1 family protein [Micromonospora sp. NPDC002389]|uniref:NPP1 family protein n=1 Tax=Micromonospora sp. NPDC002389 TaxID=3154272 RepID=UPI0033221DC5